MTTVEFPGLWGLHFVINRVAFEVLGISIYWYGIIISMGFLLAVLLALRSSKKFGFEPDTIIDLALFATPAAIICARLYYVAFSWDEFKDQPINILNTRTGGLAIYGGILGAIIVAYIFSRVRKINILSLLDFGMPFVALGQSIGRWGNFVNQEAFGINTTLPWGMTSDVVKQELLRNMDKLSSQRIAVDPNAPVHPTFLYESIWDISVFLFLIWYRKRKKMNGEVFFLYMVLYGVGRFFIEALRTDSLMIGNLRISQVLAFVFVAVFGVLLIVRRKKTVESAESVEIGTSSYGAVLKKMQDEEHADVQDIDAGTGTRVNDDAVDGQRVKSCEDAVEDGKGGNIDEDDTGVNAESNKEQE